MKLKMFVGKLRCINKVVCYNISGVKYNTKCKELTTVRFMFANLMGL